MITTGSKKNNPFEITVLLADAKTSIEQIKGWRHFNGKVGDEAVKQARNDVREYMEDATVLIGKAAKGGYYASSLQEFRRMKKDPDVVFCLLAQADEKFGRNYVGFLLARKTWQDNIKIEYTAQRPDLLSLDVKQVGQALRYGLYKYHEILRLKCIWSEATPVSIEFHRRITGKVGGFDFYKMSRAFVNRNIKSMETRAVSGNPFVINKNG